MVTQKKIAAVNSAFTTAAKVRAKYGALQRTVSARKNLKRLFTGKG